MGQWDNGTMGQWDNGTKGQRTTGKRENGTTKIKNIKNKIMIKIKFNS